MAISTNNTTNTIVVTSTGPKGEAGGSNIVIKDDGGDITSSASSIDFVGTGVTASASGDNVTVTITGGGGGGGGGQFITVIDESTTLTSSVSQFTFTGDGVTVTEPVSDQVTVTIPGGGGSFTAGDGLDLTSTEFSADLKANGGLVIESTEIAVDLGASSITGTLGVADGGTGATTLAANSVLTGNGTSAVVAEANLTYDGQLLDVKNDGTDQSEIRLYCESSNAHYVGIAGSPHAGAASHTLQLPLQPGTAGQVLKVDSVNGSTQQLAFTSNIAGNAAGLSSTLAVGSGGTGATTLGDGHVLLGNGTSAVSSVDVTAKGSILVGDGSGDPSALAVGTNNYVLTADSNEATGLKWAAASGGSGTSLVGQNLTYIVRSAALSSAGHYEGLVMKVGDAGNTLTAGTVYYFNASQNDWVAASNAAEATAKGILGIALGNSGTSDGVLVQGVYYYSDAAGAAGDILYLSTAGAMTQTAPTANGNILRVLGQNIDNNRVMFQPSQDFVELGAAAGTTALSNLSDVTVTSPAAGHVLVYDNTDSRFENATLTAGTNVTIANADASVTISACDGTEIKFASQSSAVNADGEAEGTIVKFGTGTLVAGKVYTHASGAWVAVDANDEAKTKGLLGMALGTSPTTHGLLIHGVGYLSHNPGSAGAVLYISHSNTGQITETQPSDAADFVRVVGYCLAGNKVYFSPSQDYIDLA